MNERERQLEYLSKHHPCFALYGRMNSARIHLPVCPDCNLSCNYCIRSLNNSDERPGVAKRVLSPKKALDIVHKAVKVCDSLKVVGIAGPGDSLVTDNAIETFRLIKKDFPQLLLCLSTNGLLLEEKADQLADVGVHTLTVTVNGIQPDIVSRICGGIYFEGNWYSGEEAAAILIQKQKAGIKKISSLGVIIKVNIVFIPGVNDWHVAEVAKNVKAWGADMVNIIPLIPQYKLADCLAPDCGELGRARKEAEQYIKVFRHCQHCRADAIGIPGISEYREELYETLEDSDSNFSHG